VLEAPFEDAAGHVETIEGKGKDDFLWELPGRWLTDAAHEMKLVSIDTCGRKVVCIIDGNCRAGALRATRARRSSSASTVPAPMGKSTKR
jgi:hypothetical protein